MQPSHGVEQAGRSKCSVEPSTKSDGSTVSKEKSTQVDKNGAPKQLFAEVNPMGG
jgi:hypothetical protein